jgi:hypothetical protein
MLSHARVWVYQYKYYFLLELEPKVLILVIVYLYLDRVFSVRPYRNKLPYSFLVTTTLKQVIIFYLMGLAEVYVRGLSQVEFHLRSSRDISAWSRATESHREHIATLDGLALLLVFTPKEI